MGANFQYALACKGNIPGDGLSLPFVLVDLEHRRLFLPQHRALTVVVVQEFVADIFALKNEMTVLADRIRQGDGLVEIR